MRELLAFYVEFEGVDAEEIGLRVEEFSCLDDACGVQVVFLSEPGCGQLTSMSEDPIVESGYWNLCLVSSSHGSYCLIQCVTRVVVGEGRENEFGRVGGSGELAVGEGPFTCSAKENLD